MSDNRKYEDNFSNKGSIMRQVLVYAGEDGYWVAEVPSLPGCISQGSTRDEAIANVKEAIALYLEVMGCSLE